MKVSNKPDAAKAPQQTEDMQQALAHLENGGVMAYPTETLWGLGCDVYDSRAVRRIFEIKGRELSQAVSVLVQDVHQAKTLAEVSGEVEKLLYLFWPGPVTFVLPALKETPDYLSPHGTIGLRCSSDPVLRQFMEQAPNPIVTTSANKSGEPPARELSDLQWLDSDVLIYRPSVKLTESKGSTVVLVSGKEIKVLRAGDFPEEEFKSMASQLGFKFAEKK